MASTYSNLGIELIGTGEQAGTWGATTNNNFSTILDNAIVGYKAIGVTSTIAGAPTVLTVSDGAASDGQKRVIEATGALGAQGYLQIAPNDFAGYYFIRNSTGQTLNVFQGTYNSGRAVAIEYGYDAIIRCDGLGATSSTVSFINYKLKTGPIYATNETSVGSVIQGSTSAAALRVTQTGSGDALLVEDSTNPDSTPFVISSTGAVGIGEGTIPAYVSVYQTKPLTGAASTYGHLIASEVKSDATSVSRGFSTSLSTDAVVFNASGVLHFHAQQATFGAGSTVSTQIGFGSAASLIGATNNYGFYAYNTAAVTTGKSAYGFYSDIDSATGGGTAWGVFSGGTANSYFAGNVGIGDATPTYKLSVNGSLSIASQFVTGGSAGTAGQLLTSAGAGVAPTWSTVVDPFPSGTRILFQGTPPPAYWNIETGAAYSNAALRVINSGTAGTGGTALFTTAFSSRTPAGVVNNPATTGATTLSTSQYGLLAHTHTYSRFTIASSTSGDVENGTPLQSTLATVNTSSASDATVSSHTHTLTDPTFTGTAMDFAVKYVDVYVGIRI